MEIKSNEMLFEESLESRTSTSVEQRKHTKNSDGHQPRHNFAGGHTRCLSNGPRGPRLPDGQVRPPW